MLAADRALFLALNRWPACGFLDHTLPWLTHLNHSKVFMALVVVGWVVAFCTGARTRRVGLVCALVALGLSDLACTHILKPAIARDRPCQLEAAAGAPNVAKVRLPPGESCPGSRSFPSNHASNMMAVGLTGWLFTRGRPRWFWLLLPAIIGYSRIYVGAHFPSDVLAGWILGACIAVALWYAFVGPRKSPGEPDAPPETFGARSSAGSDSARA